MTRGWRLGLLMAIGFWSLAPIAFLVVLSLSRSWFFPMLLPSVWSLDNWRQLTSANSALRDALLTSILLAVVTAIVACLVALPFGRSIARATGWRRQVAAALAFAPVAVPPIALATGLHFSVLSLGLGGRFTGVLMAHLVPAIGYLSLFFVSVFTSYDARIEDEARTLGATPRDVWRRITWPLLKRPIADALALGFLISWAQVPLTLLIGGGRVRTIPIDVFSAVRAGDDARAAAGALLLIVPALIAMVGVRTVVRRTEALVL